MIKIVTRDGFSVTTTDVDILTIEDAMAGVRTDVSRPSSGSGAARLIRVKRAGSGLYVSLRTEDIIRAEEVAPERKS